MIYDYVRRRSFSLCENKDDSVDSLIEELHALIELWQNNPEEFIKIKKDQKSAQKSIEIMAERDNPLLYRLARLFWSFEMRGALDIVDDSFGSKFITPEDLRASMRLQVLDSLEGIDELFEEFIKDSKQ